MPSLREARRLRAAVEEEMAPVSRDEGAAEIEQRNMALTAWPTGYGLADPTAIPPPGLGQMQRAGVPVTPQTSLQVDAVFTSLRIITTAINLIGDVRPYRTAWSDDNIPYRNWIPEEIPFLEKSFGPDTMQYDGRRRTVMSMALFQEAFWHIIERDDLGYASAVDVRHPGFMKVGVNKDGTKIYEYGTPADHITLPAENVVYIPNMAMPGGTRGLSSIQYGGVIFALALAAMEYGQKWFAQGASPSYILKTTARLNQSEVTRLAQRFLFEHGGLSNAHLPLILDNGMDAQKMQAHPDEAQYLQTLEYARTAVAAFFGIPSFLIPNGLERDVPEPPGVIGERGTVFVNYTLSGYLVPFEEVYTGLIQTGKKAGYDTSRLTAPDSKDLAALLFAIRNSQVGSVNDVRTRFLGWAPSTEPDADKVVVPLASNTASNWQGSGAGETEKSDEPSPGTKKDKSGPDGTSQGAQSG